MRQRELEKPAAREDLAAFRKAIEAGGGVIVVLVGGRWFTYPATDGHLLDVERRPARVPYRLR